jgi:hypothetical protein
LVTIHIDKQKVLEKLEEWMDWLETPNDDFGGFPVCPFLAPERKTNKLLIEFYNFEEGSIFESIKKFDKNDDYTTALYLHVKGSWKKQKTKDYGQWVTNELGIIGLGHLKAVCFSPWEKVTRNKVRTRMKAPCFITSITTQESLNDAWKKIKDTNYWKKNRENA